MIGLIFWILVGGGVCWLVNQFPIAPLFKNAIYLVIVIALVVFALDAFNLYHLPGARR